MVKINRIYTKTGDSGKTYVIGGQIPKSSIRLEVTGAIDEVNAQLGVCRTIATEHKLTDFNKTFEQLQQQLFDLGAEVATINAERLQSNQRITPEIITSLEKQIDQICENLPELTSFVLPGGDLLNSHLHLARTVCRRAELKFWQLKEDSNEICPEYAAIYLNRLSDLLFALARKASLDSGTAEFLWKN
jgi:cob(I)alamin adenosyltransferase